MKDEQQNIGHPANALHVEMSEGEITRLLNEIAVGNDRAKDDLFDFLYHELHTAAKRLIQRERPNHSLQPTELVNLMYLKLFAKNNFIACNRAYFWGAVGRAMKQILVDHARKRRFVCTPLDDVLNWLHTTQQINMLDFEEALDDLQRLKPRHYEIVIRKLFAGSRMEKIAQDLELSLATVEKDWKFARGWLHQRLGEYAR